ncbi:hypothetical protein [Caulobacter sp. S45]|jgi:hypothetical protein|uniref:hypothetical protein n=1 Tax=Caulobacter sp. S45 TaxID=1641861 RepID=UPI00131ADCF4|nr:hypothetical protein [Caulobacter sp. S45]
MYFVVRRTWLAGADPTGEPDIVKTVAKAVSHEAAEQRAAILAQASSRARLDAEQGVWLCKAPDALHVFQVVAEDEASATVGAARGGARTEVVRVSMRLLGASA